MTNWPAVFSTADDDIAADKKKGPASAPTLPDRGSVNTDKGNQMNTASNTTTALEQQAEHPAITLRRLADELSIIMTTYPEAPSAAVIFPADIADYPVMLMMCSDYAEVIRAAFAYRKAHQEKVRLYHKTFGPNESVPLPELPKHKAYWDAFHRASLAHMALMDAFDVDLVIEGEAS